MLCRNRVADFLKWKAVFDAHLEAQADSGLRLLDLWRSVEDPNNVFTQLFYNAVRPDTLPSANIEWRFQLNFLFPK